MKKGNFIRLFRTLFLLIIFSVFESCEDNYRVTGEKLIGYKNITIDEAREIFESDKDNFIFSETLRMKLGESWNSYEELVNSKSLLWSSALYKDDGSMSVVTVPMDMGNGRWFYDSNSKMVHDLNTLNYLRMYRNANNNVQTEWVTLVPDEKWIKNDLELFTGKVMLRNWSGQFIRGYQYDIDGSVKALRLTDSSQEAANRTNSLVSKFCYQFTGNIPCDLARLSSTNSCTKTVGFEYCVTVVSEPDPVTGSGSGSIPTSAQWAQTSSGNGLGGGGSAGGSYVPNACNPNLPAGTQVSSNQLPPCTRVTAAIPALNNGITRAYSSLNNIINDNYFTGLWNKLSEAEKNYFKTGSNWIYLLDYLINYAQVIAAGNLYFTFPDRDNSNANAFRHMLLTGLNSFVWGEERARQVGALHEQNHNASQMDSINNEEGIKLARTHRSSVSLISAISNYMRSTNTGARKHKWDLPGEILIPTDGSGRTDWGKTH